ncbi:hypothetical protein LPTSP3_g15810 [Leptospira kobayashii]|uniref:SHSP domain-containing protein n=2 Tax=Leptospira kobayashii TaxID=1917830 RepID=A0ABM7UIR6_9LEPT|nr:hypothetical protein LPTSP3_g15810 [Leptospira kobayashii]
MQYRTKNTLAEDLDDSNSKKINLLTSQLIAGNPVNLQIALNLRRIPYLPLTIYRRNVNRKEITNLENHFMSSLTKSIDPFHNLNNLEHFFHNWNELFHKDWIHHIPAVNVSKSATGYKMELAVPGLDKKDFKIDIDGDLLTIKAEKKTDTKEEDKHYSKREYNYSSFNRSFTLPEAVDREKIIAKYENGILQLSVPLKEGSSKPESLKIGVQ